MRKQGLTKRTTSGFTLLELMVALGIAAIVMSVGIPTFRNSLDNQRMTAATNDLVMTMNLAKSEAIKRVAYVTVCKSTNGTDCSNGASWNDGWIVFENSSNAQLEKVDVGDEIIRVFTALDERIEISAVGGVGNFLSFRPSGTIGTSGGNISGTLTTCDKRGADHARGLNLQSSGQWAVSHYVDHSGSSLVCN